MKQNIEEILNLAIEEIKTGKTFSEVLNMHKFQAYKTELNELLPFAYNLYKIPKKNIPAPSLQRKYILAKPAVHKFLLFHLPRFAFFSISLIMLLSAGVGTGYAALGSLPGDTLFPVKKSAEQLQLRFASTPEKKATLQVELSKKRLAEAQEVLKTSQDQPEKIKAAVSELTEQNKTTLISAEAIVKNSTDTARTSQIIESLENINLDQKELAKEIAHQDFEEISKTAEVSASESSDKVAEIKKIAASALVNLGGTKDEDLSASSSALSETDMTASSTVEALEKTEVKGAFKNTTTTDTSISSGNTVINSNISGEIGDDKPVTLQEQKNSEPDPNIIHSGFIVEDPLPQFNK